MMMVRVGGTALSTGATRAGAFMPPERAQEAFTGPTVPGDLE
jgi:hypothetical protein